MEQKTHYIGPRRRLFQWAGTLTVLLIPWLDWQGRSLLRIDLAGRQIFIFGQVLRIQELYLVMLAALVLVLTFILVTVVLGRVWCGWCCPQSTWSDAAEWAARRLGLQVRHNRLRGSLRRKALLQGILLLLALLVSANLLWYFIPPRIFLVKLLDLDLPYAAGTAFALASLLVYLDLSLVRRLMCREFCPYGRIQTALVDQATLSLHLPETELERCMECHACRRACPMEIDIRQGYQVECTNCGRCLDACRRMMSRRGEPGLIRYTFGLHNEGAGGLINPRVLLPAAAAIALLIVLVFALVDRPSASLRVAISHTAPSRLLADGRTATFFSAWLNNRGLKQELYTVQARDGKTGVELALRGRVQASLPPGGNQRLDFALLTPAEAKERLAVEFILTNENGSKLTTAEALIKPSSSMDGARSKLNRIHHD